MPNKYSRPLRSLIRAAAAQGLRLSAARLPQGVFGFYSPDEARIYFDLSLTPTERAVTIAHELGHAHHGHTCDSARAERQADTYAAQALINDDDYAQLERVSADRYYLADELGVTVELVDHYRAHCLQRLGERTYSTLGRHPFAALLARAAS